MRPNDEKRAEARKEYQREHQDYYKEKRKAYMEAHPEKKKEYWDAYYSKNKEAVDAKRRVWVRNRTKRQRGEILDLLGGKCSACGFSDPRALHIDHVENDGGEDRKKYRWTTGYYKAIRESLSNGQHKYQILCANCHEIKHDED